MKTKSLYGGQFYPENKEELRQMFFDFESDIKPHKIEKIFAAIVPHAGYIYSGKCAMFAYKAIKDYNFDTAIVLGRSNRYHFEHAALNEADEIETPLGDIKIDKEIEKYLLSKSIFENDPSSHKGEHSLEVQMPFIKYINEKAKVVGVLLGNEQTDISEDLFETIKKFSDKKIVIICSTDLSHYHEYSEAKKLDGKFREMLEKFDLDGLRKSIDDENKTEACAMVSVINTLSVAKLASSDNIEILHACNSGDTRADKSRVVGYLSAVIW